MKFFSFLVSLIFFGCSTLAQLPGFDQVDSLTHLLSSANQDSERILLMAKICEAYRGTKPDSALFFGEKALALARKVKYTKGEVNALLSMSVVHRELGNLPKAFELALKSLQMAQGNHFAPEEVNSLNRVGLVYVATKNFGKALSYFHQAEARAKQGDARSLEPIVQLLLAETFEQMDRLDSASYYTRLLYPKLFESELLPQRLFRTLGNIEVKQGHFSQAIAHYHQAIREADKRSDYRTASTVYNDFASLYKKLNQIDSAIYYAKQGLFYGQKLSFANRILTASTLLAELYEPTDTKEAFHFRKIADAAKDSLYGAEKVRELQTTMLEEQDRQRKAEAAKIAFQNAVRQYTLLGGIAVLCLIAGIMYRNNRSKQKAYKLLKKQKAETDNARTRAEAALEELKSTQAQLIQSEKMASLGELTAGIAHEIQNPLNFMNNFSEVNTELIDEAELEINKGNINEIKTILNDIKENEQKINHHGKRADAIVKGMLQHSRVSTGQKEATDMNALADEYLRLSYHGMRARDRDFNATIKTDFDPSIGKISVVPQDIGRVLLNLYNNAFYAVTEKKKQIGDAYEPKVTVATKALKGALGPLAAEIRIKDNGTGIPQKVVDKIFQPFFTTKPTGRGTGLGLSLAYDIVKAHGGEIKVETRPLEAPGGSEFIIQLPIS